MTGLTFVCTKNEALWWLEWSFKSNQLKELHNDSDCCRVEFNRTNRGWCERNIKEAFRGTEENAWMAALGPGWWENASTLRWGLSLPLSAHSVVLRTDPGETRSPQQDIPVFGGCALFWWGPGGSWLIPAAGLSHPALTVDVCFCCHVVCPSQQGSKLLNHFQCREQLQTFYVQRWRWIPFPSHHLRFAHPTSAGETSV